MSTTPIKNRIKELRNVRAGDLFANPDNWRTHPTAQVAAMQGVLAEIGYADALLARELPDGTLELVDGHLRQSLDPEQVVPVLVLDLDQDEARKLLATLDPLAAMAETNREALENLLESITVESEAVDAMLQGMLGDTESDGETKLNQLDVKPPPAMTWALIGTPTVHFGEIAETIEAIGEIDGVILETTANDG